jgi:hypothetical protein
MKRIAAPLVGGIFIPFLLETAGLSGQLPGLEVELRIDKKGPLEKGRE